MRLRTLGSLCVIGIVASAAPRDAHALGPIDLEVAGSAGVGFEPADLKVNPYGFGLGARAGVRLVGLYGGVRAAYYVGQASLDVTQLGVELGYGPSFGPVTLRGGVGLGHFTAGGSISTSTTHLYIAPNLTALVRIPTSPLFVGADVEYTIVTGDSAWNSPAAHAQVGVIF